MARLGFIDERFLTHRRKSTSAGGLAAVAVAMGLFVYRLYADHRFDWGLLAVGIVAVVVKYAVFFWHRRTTEIQPRKQEPTMSLRDRFQNPKTLMRLGMAFLVVALVAQRFVHPPRFAEDFADAVRGLCLGLSIGLNLWSVRLTARRRGCGAAPTNG